jgi:ribosomal protein L12E/L44/L45/RPP1/RPP2
MPGLSGAPGAAAAGGAAGLSQMAQMFKGIVGSNGGIKFGDMVVITGQAVTVDAPTAKSLADVVQAIASIAAMAGAGNDPNVAALAQLMQGLKVTADGVNVNITLSVPEAQLEAVINQMKKPHTAPAARPGAKPALAPLPAGTAGSRMIAAR